MMWIKVNYLNESIQMKRSFLNRLVKSYARLFNGDNENATLKHISNEFRRNVFIFIIDALANHQIVVGRWMKQKRSRK